MCIRDRAKDHPQSAHFINPAKICVVPFLRFLRLLAISSCCLLYTSGFGAAGDAQLCEDIADLTALGDGDACHAAAADNKNFAHD